MRAGYHNLRGFNGVEATEVINLYSERKRLAALGITLQADQIPAWICDAFLTIESTIDTIQAEETAKAKKKTARKR